MHNVAPRLKAWFIVIGVLLLLISVAFKILSPSQAFDVPRIPLVGNQFEGPVADVVGPFETLMKCANTQIFSFQKSAARSDVASFFMSWLAILITSSITILAAFAGVNPNQLPPTGERSKLVIIIAVLAAFSSSLLLINERVQKSAGESRKQTLQLFDQASASRNKFVNAKLPEEAQAAKDQLFRALADLGSSSCT
jgi:hypothetical protein